LACRRISRLSPSPLALASRQQWFAGPALERALARRRVVSPAVRPNAASLGSKRLRTATQTILSLPGAPPRDASAPVFGVALALPLMVYASIGSFARYVADDYCWAGVLRTEGFLKAQAWWYLGYSPRYAFTFLVNAVELAGTAIVPVLPSLAIVMFVTTLTWTIAGFGLRTMSAVVLAELAAFAVFQTAPDLPQSLYWQTGMLTYLLPLVLATFLIGWIRRAIARWWAVLLSGVLTFVAGGLSETYLIPQNVALTLALAASLLFTTSTGAGRIRSVHLAAALAGGVLALAAILIAPATSYRVGGSPADVWLASSAALATAAYQVLRLARYFWPAALLCVALPSIVSVRQCRVDRRWFWLVTAGVAITLPFCYFPSFYAQNGNPPARSLIVPGAILVGYLLVLGCALQSFVRPRLPSRAAALAMVLLVAVPVVAAATSLPERAVAAQHAALWDAEDQQIRASRDAGQSDVLVPPLPAYLGEDFVTPDRNNWFNVCVARYYGVRSIATF